MTQLKRFLRDESGATAIEYGLIASLLSILVVGGSSLAGGEIQGLFTDVGTCIQNARAQAVC